MPPNPTWGIDAIAGVSPDGSGPDWRGSDRPSGTVGQMELWHNPRCSKSRAAKALLDGRSLAYSERRYLDDPPDAATFDRVLTMLGREPWDIARLGEPVAAELGLRDRPHDRADWVAVLVANPILIERPILVTDDGRAALGRPLEAIEAVL